MSVRASCQSSVRKGQRYFGLMTHIDTADNTHVYNIVAQHVNFILIYY